MAPPLSSLVLTTLVLLLAVCAAVSVVCASGGAAAPASRVSPLACVVSSPFLDPNNAPQQPPSPTTSLGDGRAAINSHRPVCARYAIVGGDLFIEAQLAPATISADNNADVRWTRQRVVQPTCRAAACGAFAAQLPNCSSLAAPVLRAAAPAPPTVNKTVAQHALLFCVPPSASGDVSVQLLALTLDGDGDGSDDDTIVFLNDIAGAAADEHLRRPGDVMTVPWHTGSGAVLFNRRTGGGAHFSSSGAFWWSVFGGSSGGVPGAGVAVVHASSLAVRQTNFETALPFAILVESAGARSDKTTNTTVCQVTSQVAVGQLSCAPVAPIASATSEGAPIFLLPSVGAGAAAGATAWVPGGGSSPLLLSTGIAVAPDFAAAVQQACEMQRSGTQVVRGAQAPWGFCGAASLALDLSSIAGGTVAQSTCYFTEHRPGGAFTLFTTAAAKYAAVLAKAPRVVATVTSAASSKRVLQIRTGSGAVVLVTYVSLSLAEAGQYFQAGCAASPLQLEHVVDLSAANGGAAASARCTFDIVAETPWIVVARNADCTLTGVDIESGAVRWTTTAAAAAVKIQPIADADADAQRLCQEGGGIINNATSADHALSMPSSPFSQVVAFASNSRIALVADSGDVLVLDIASGAVVATLSVADSAARRLLPCVSVLDNGTATVLLGVSVPRNQSGDGGEEQFVVLLVPESATPADRRSSAQLKFSFAMSSLAAVTIGAPLSWRGWNDFETWTGVETSTFPWPLWSLSLNGAAGPVPTLTLLHGAWVSTVLNLDLEQLAVVAPATLSLLPAGRFSFVRPAPLLVAFFFIDVSVCPPAAEYAFAVADQRDNVAVRITALGPKDRAAGGKCVGLQGQGANVRGGLLYSEFRVENAQLRGTGSAADYSSNWQGLLTRTRSLTLKRAAITGTMPDPVAEIQHGGGGNGQSGGGGSGLTALDVQLESLDLSLNAQVTGTVFLRPWPRLRSLVLAGTGVTSPPPGPLTGYQQLLFTVHLVDCDTAPVARNRYSRQGGGGGGDSSTSSSSSSAGAGGFVPYALEYVDVSNCAGLVGVLAGTTGDGTCIAPRLRQVVVVGVAVTDAIDMRASSNQTAVRLSADGADPGLTARAVLLVIDPAAIVASGVSVVCTAAAATPLRLAVPAATDDAWAPCAQVAQQSSAAYFRPKAFAGIVVLDAGDRRAWLPIQPLCTNIAVGYTTGNFPDAASSRGGGNGAASDLRVNTTSVLLQFYPSLVDATATYVAMEGAPATPSPATVMVRVNSFRHFADNETRADRLCAAFPLHWWMLSVPVSNATSNANAGAASRHRFVFRASIERNLTACIAEVLRFHWRNASVSDAMVVAARTATEWSVEALNTTALRRQQASAAATARAQQEQAQQGGDNGGGSGDGGASIGLPRTYVAEIEDAGGERGVEDSQQAETLQDRYQQQFIYTLEVNATAQHVNDTARLVPFAWSLASSDGAVGGASPECPNYRLLQVGYFCLTETPPTYHRIDFWTNAITTSRIETGTTPSQINCTVGPMQMTILADGTVFPWAAVTTQMDACSPQQYSISGTVESCGYVPLTGTSASSGGVIGAGSSSSSSSGSGGGGDSYTTMHCVGYAAGIVRRSTFTTSFCTLHWRYVPLCRVIRFVTDSDVGNGEVSLPVALFGTRVAYPGRSSAFYGCNVESHPSNGIAVSSFLRMGRCHRLAEVFPAPYQNLSVSTLQRITLQRQVKACTRAAECSFYNATTGDLSCDLVANKIRLLALCFAVQGIAISAAEDVLDDLTQQLVVNCSTKPGSIHAWTANISSNTNNDNSNGGGAPSGYFRVTSALFSQSIADIFVEPKFDTRRDTTHWVLCNPSPLMRQTAAIINSMFGGATSTSTTAAAAIAPSSGSTQAPSTTTTTAAASPAGSASEERQTVVFSFRNGECTSGIQVQSSFCMPYVEPDVFTMSYFVYVFAAVRDILFMLIGLGILSIGFVRRAWGAFYARFLFNLAPFYSDEREEWMGKFSKRVAPRTVGISEVSKNFLLLVQDCPTYSARSSNALGGAITTASNLSGPLDSHAVFSIQQHAQAAVTGVKQQQQQQQPSAVPAALKVRKGAENGSVEEPMLAESSQSPMSDVGSGESSPTSSSLVEGGSPASPIGSPTFVNFAAAQNAKLAGGDEDDDDEGGGSNDLDGMAAPQSHKLWFEFEAVNRLMSRLAAKLKFVGNDGGAGGGGSSLAGTHDGDDHLSSVEGESSVSYASPAARGTALVDAPPGRGGGGTRASQYTNISAVSKASSIWNVSAKSTRPKDEGTIQHQQHRHQRHLSGESELLSPDLSQSSFAQPQTPGAAPAAASTAAAAAAAAQQSALPPHAHHSMLPQHSRLSAATFMPDAGASEEEIVRRDDFHLFERIVLNKGRQLVVNADDEEVRHAFQALLFAWAQHGAYDLRFHMREMGRRELRCLQAFLKVAQFEDIVLEHDTVKLRFTPAIWLLTFQFLYCVFYFVMCVVRVYQLRRLDTSWRIYQALYFRYLNACTPISLLTNSLLRRFYKEDLRPDFFSVASLLMLLPAILTHVLPGIVVYIWVVLLALGCLMVMLFFGEFYRRHGREVLQARIVATLKRRSRNDAAGSGGEMEPPGTARRRQEEREERAAAIAAARATRQANTLSWVVFIGFRIGVTLVIAVLFQTLFNYMVLFYAREELGVDYGSVVSYEWDSRTVTCSATVATHAIANTLQFLSFLF